MQNLENISRKDSTIVALGIEQSFCSRAQNLVKGKTGERLQNLKRFR